MENMYDVSIVVSCYNSIWTDLKRTVKSYIRQRNVKIQIIVADDGSKIKYENELIELFRIEKFCDYKLVMNESNAGTVRNFLTGLNVCDGRYVKPISPGDYAYDEMSVYKMFKYCIENKTDFVFGDAVYYSTNCGINILMSHTSPRKKDIYLRDKYSHDVVLKRLCLIGDNISGAIVFGTKAIFVELMEEVSPYVKYCEDVAYGLLPLKNIRISYLPESIIWYQYGTGISTKGRAASPMRKAIAEDMRMFWKNVSLQYKLPNYIRRVNLYYDIRVRKNNIFTKLLKVMVCPERFFLRGKDKYIPKYEIEKLQETIAFAED